MSSTVVTAHTVAADTAVLATTASKVLLNPSGFRDLTGDIDRAQATGGGVNLLFTTFRGNVEAWRFTAAASVSNRLSVKYHVDHDLDLTLREGYFHVHTAPAAAGQTGNSVWKLEYTIARGHGQEAFPATQTISLTVPTSGTQYMHQITEVLVPIDLLEPDTLIKGSVYRDGAAGTDAGNIFLIEADFHYSANVLATSMKAPPWA